MAYSKNVAAVNGVVELIIIALVMISGGSAGDYNGLTPNFYDKSCPEVLSIVRSVVEKAVAKEARMAASLLRLQFHDCFVQGCDGSLLLDDTPTFRGEKTAVPNNNSVRGFDVIDEIKREVESACPGVVSCADIIAIAARDSVVLSGGLEWSVAVGRRDSRGASLSGANRNIPAPNNTLNALITKFKRQGLDQVDLVALSGGHTIGQSRCTSFRQRLYNQTGKGEANLTIQSNYLGELKSACPISGGDNNLSPLDVVSPTQFNNHYFLNLKSGRGLLNSDVQLLYAGSNDQFITGLVDAYAADQTLFFNQFADSMVKMGSIKPLTGSMGEIRTNCRRMN